jgi:SAM-dependent methyltransferase
MDKDQVDWFTKNVLPLERAYLRGETPWQRSGVGLHNPRTYEYWKAVRMPIAESVDRSGSVLDIGCANGYLLESLIRWQAVRDITIEPYGLDISEELLREARQRLPEATFYNTNVWGWKAPKRYDHVITELVYVPEEHQQIYLEGLLRDAVEEEGKLIVTQYSSDISREPDLEAQLSGMGFKIAQTHVGKWEGITKSAVAVITGVTHPEPPR